MSVRSCRVTIQDMDGVSHTVEVTAATLYEAVAQGLAAIRGHDRFVGTQISITLETNLAALLITPVLHSLEEWSKGRTVVLDILEIWALHEVLLPLTVAAWLVP
jgi:hypothetical protein